MNAMGSGLDFDTPTDLALRLALSIGLGALALTLLLVLQVGLLRVLQRRRQHTRTDINTRWRPLLLRHAIGDFVRLPKLLPHERMVFMLMWNQLADNLRGPSHDRLRHLMMELDLHALAQRWLTRRNPERRLLGLLTLGHLGRAADWHRVLAFLGNPEPYVSLSAARALLQIDPARAATPVLDELTRRPEWPLARLALLLREAGGAPLVEPLRKRLLQAAPAQQLRLGRLLAFVDAVRASPTLVQLLENSDEPELLSMCLQHVQTPPALPRVRELTRHPVWWVRSHAAMALARLGTQADKDLLLGLLTDPHWWVRYRAAHALVCIPGLTRQAVLALRDTLADGYARDVLAHVLRERELA